MERGTTLVPSKEFHIPKSLHLCTQTLPPASQCVTVLLEYLNILTFQTVKRKRMPAPTSTNIMKKK
jgi:hypothetical protein